MSSQTGGPVYWALLDHRDWIIVLIFLIGLYSFNPLTTCSNNCTNSGVV
jgi:hypothetical protein